MNRLLCLFFLQFIAASTLAQSLPSGGPNNTRQSPDALVQSLYRQVVARHPLGLLAGSNRKIFEPYLSKALLHRIELTRSCQNDWLRQNKGQMLANQVPEKAPFAWGELGLFSGDEELSEPSSFQIERTESNKDGSFRVYVKLTENPPNHKPWSWDVAVQVKMEERRPVVDDIVYLKGDDVLTEYRLSELLTEGCNGSHWVGHGNKNTKP